MIYFKCLRCKKEPILEEGVQIIDAGKVCGKEHLNHAIIQAMKSFRKSRNISKDMLLEVLVRLSAQRQIRKAIEIFGLKKGIRDVVVISLDEKKLEEFVKKYECVEDIKIIEVDEKKYEELRKIFNINDNEILAYKPKDFNERVEILKRLIIERIALLNLE